MKSSEDCCIAKEVEKQNNKNYSFVDDHGTENK